MTSHISLGSVLVVGGCGFLGHHLVRELLADPAVSKISVMARDTSINRFDNVNYLAGDVTSVEDVYRIVFEVKPTVIINTASPKAYTDHEHAGDYFTVNVNGNRFLLAAAKAVGVKAYVYTSSGPIIAGSGGEYDHADEHYPTLAERPSKGADPYHVAKALGDKFVINSNDPAGVRTATIRPTAMYGEGDKQMIGEPLRVLKNGQQNIWLGYNKTDLDVVYVGHVAEAHILAAKGLISGISDSNAPKVEGEAFNITDDQPHNPWDFFSMIWAAAGDKTPRSKVWMLPPWLVLFLAIFAEFWTWFFSGGRKRPTDLVKERVEFVLYTRTYDITKARERLGFKPWVNQKDAIQRAVDWQLKGQSFHPVVEKRLICHHCRPAAIWPAASLL